MAKALNEFQKHCKMLKQLGIEFNLDYEYRGEGKDRKSHTVEIFTNVKVPFSAYELVGILMNDGQFYIGGCCGNSSALQDKVESVLRFGQGWIDIRDLEYIAEARIHHDGDESEFKALKRSLDKEVTWFAGQLKKMKDSRQTGKKVCDPWYWMAVAWHITKSFYNPERARPEAHVVNPKRSILDDAISLLSRNLTSLAINKMFASQDGGVTTQDTANRLITVARLLPALKTLNDGIDQLAPLSINGVALVLAEDPANVLANRLGLCVYNTVEEAQAVIDLTIREDAQYIGEGKDRRQPGGTDYRIRKVRVTQADGLQFRDEAEDY